MVKIDNHNPGLYISRLHHDMSLKERTKMITFLLHAYLIEQTFQARHFHVHVNSSHAGFLIVWKYGNEE